MAEGQRNAYDPDYGIYPDYGGSDSDGLISRLFRSRKRKKRSGRHKKKSARHRSVFGRTKKAKTGTRVKFTKRGQPYVIDKATGRARFIKRR